MSITILSDEFGIATLVLCFLVLIAIIVWEYRHDIAMFFMTAWFNVFGAPDNEDKDYFSNN